MISIASRARRSGWLLVGLLLLCHTVQAEPQKPSFDAANAPTLTIWTNLQVDLDRDREVISHCRFSIETCSDPAARRFIAIVDEGAGYEGRARIAHINRAANLAIRYRVENSEAWTSPLTALAAGTGDCKQFAVLKYAALKESGIAADRLHILIVEDKARHAAHAVVAVRDGTQWLVLNNRNSTLIEFGDFLRQYSLLGALNQGQFAEFWLQPQEARTAF